MTVRSLLAATLAATLAAALVPAAALAAPARATSPGLSAGGFIGYETDDIDGLALRFDAELPFGALSPELDLSWVGSIGFSHLTDDELLVEATANILKLVPAARLSFPVNPDLTLYADAGLGLFFSSWEIERPGRDLDDTEVGLMMRIGGGAWFQVNEATRIGAAIELNPYFGDVIGEEDQTTFIIQAGAMFRL